MGNMLVNRVKHQLKRLKGAYIRNSYQLILYRSFCFPPGYPQDASQDCITGRKLNVHNITWKVSVFGFILVHIFPHSDWIRTRITPNMDTFTQLRHSQDVQDVIERLRNVQFTSPIQGVISKLFDILKQLLEAVVNSYGLERLQHRFLI